MPNLTLQQPILLPQKMTFLVLSLYLCVFARSRQTAGLWISVGNFSKWCSLQNQMTSNSPSLDIMGSEQPLSFSCFLIYEIIL